MCVYECRISGKLELLAQQDTDMQNGHVSKASEHASEPGSQPSAATATEQGSYEPTNSDARSRRTKARAMATSNQANANARSRQASPPASMPAKTQISKHARPTSERANSHVRSRQGSAAPSATDEATEQPNSNARSRRAGTVPEAPMRMIPKQATTDLGSQQIDAQKAGQQVRRHQFPSTQRATNNQ